MSVRTGKSVPKTETGEERREWVWRRKKSIRRAGGLSAVEVTSSERH